MERNDPSPGGEIAEPMDDIASWSIEPAPNARTAIVAPPAGLLSSTASAFGQDAGGGNDGPQHPDEPSGGLGGSPGHPAPPPYQPDEAHANGRDLGYDEFGSGSSTMFVPGVEAQMSTSAAQDRQDQADLPTAVAPSATLPPEATPPPVLDDLDLEFALDRPVPARELSPEEGRTPELVPLDAAALGDIEQIDFFLEQGLQDEAQALLDDLPPALAEHPAVRERRSRLQELGSGRAQDEIPDHCPRPWGPCPAGP